MLTRLDRRSLLSRMGAMAIPGFLPSEDGSGIGSRRRDAAPVESDAPEERPDEIAGPVVKPGRVRTRSAAGRPNVIVVVTDDMRTSDWVALPEISRIVGGKGAVFPNFIVNTPICGPSRATLFTGKLPKNHGVLENEGDGIDAWTAMQNGIGHRSTIYNAAQKAGYRTGLVGKFLNGAPPSGRIAPGLDRWYSTSELDYFDFELNENGETKAYTGDAYSTDVLAEHAIAFIEETPAEQPFLLFFTPKAPKGPATPNRQFREAFGDGVPARNPAWNEADVSDKPESIRRRKPMNPQEIADLDDKERRRLATLLSVDAAFDNIWRAVRRVDRADNTIVMVMSDNGYILGEHLLNGKGRPYDAAVRVTMMASGPGFEGRGTDERMASMADVAPTLAHLMGLRLPDPDGSSLAEPWAREYVPIETPGGKEAYWAIRGQHELYVEYETGEREYYDYLADPWELDNQLADWDGHVPSLDPEKAAQLASRLAAFRSCTGETCRGTHPPA